MLLSYNLITYNSSEILIDNHFRYCNLIPFQAHLWADLPLLKQAVQFLTSRQAHFSSTNNLSWNPEERKAMKAADIKPVAVII